MAQHGRRVEHSGGSAPPGSTRSRPGPRGLWPGRFCLPLARRVTRGRWGQLTEELHLLAALPRRRSVVRAHLLQTVEVQYTSAGHRRTWVLQPAVLLREGRIRFLPSCSPPCGSRRLTTSHRSAPCRRARCRCSGKGTSFIGESRGRKADVRTGQPKPVQAQSAPGGPGPGWLSRPALPLGHGPCIAPRALRSHSWA